MYTSLTVFIISPDFVLVDHHLGCSAWEVFVCSPHQRLLFVGLVCHCCCFCSEDQDHTALLLPPHLCRSLCTRDCSVCWNHGCLRDCWKWVVGQELGYYVERLEGGVEVSAQRRQTQRQELLIPSLVGQELFYPEKRDIFWSTLYNLWLLTLKAMS